MNSNEGEAVDFIHPVILEGQVEQWLCAIGNSVSHKCSIKIVTQLQLDMFGSVTKKIPAQVPNTQYPLLSIENPIETVFNSALLPMFATPKKARPSGIRTTEHAGEQ